MDSIQSIKQASGNFQLLNDKASVLSAKLQDLAFRAQRIASAKRSGSTSQDHMFGYDLQTFRREARAFNNEIASLPAQLNMVQRLAVVDEGAVKHATELLRWAITLNKALTALCDLSHFAHGHVRQADAKVEAWFVVQELEQLAEQSKVLPKAANTILTSVPPPSKPSQGPIKPVVDTSTLQIPEAPPAPPKQA